MQLECNKARKIGEYLDKKCSCRKRLFCELVLACENEIKYSGDYGQIPWLWNINC